MHLSGSDICHFICSRYAPKEAKEFSQEILNETVIRLRLFKSMAETDPDVMQ